MRAIVATLLLLAACDGADVLWSPPDELGWAFEPTCIPPTAAEFREIKWGATELWRMVGVHTTQVDADPDVWVCLRSGAPRPGYSGWQSWQDDGTALVEVSRAMRIDRFAVVVAHEFGHAILPGSGDEDHLPPGQVGVLAAHPDGFTWTSNDEAFLATFGGFIPVLRAHD